MAASEIKIRIMSYIEIKICYRLSPLTLVWQENERYFKTFATFKVLLISAEKNPDLWNFYGSNDMTSLFFHIFMSNIFEKYF